MTHRNSGAGDIVTDISTSVDVGGQAPWREDQEWANALTHGLGALGAAVAGWHLVSLAAAQSSGLAIACAAYIASVFGTFLFSTLSHLIHRQPMLNTMRAWDQAMIYAMITGTYTPIVFRFAPESTAKPLLAAIWIAAAVGFLHKVALRHRINASGALSYLMLGWLPAIPMAGHVPASLAWVMLGGGVVYTIGVVVLINDEKFKYMHAVWHVCVITAASVHYMGILYFTVLM